MRYARGPLDRACMTMFPYKHKGPSNLHMPDTGYFCWTEGSHPRKMHLVTMMMGFYEGN